MTATAWIITIVVTIVIWVNVGWQTALLALLMTGVATLAVIDAASKVIDQAYIAGREGRPKDSF